MGQDQLLPVGRALIAALLAVSPVAAQGPVYRESWGYLHLERRREELWHALAAAEPALRDAVADLLLEPDEGFPFRPVARALARVRGVPADAAFVLRATLGVFLLPEVADPEAKNEMCRDTHVSVFLPFPVPLPGALAFDVHVLDPAGKKVWSTRIERDTTFEDLRLAQVAADVPSHDLPDGRYELVVHTLVDGQQPRASDPEIRWPMHVLRGYQARSEAGMLRANELAKDLPELPRALLTGIAAQVGRAYSGEPFAVRSNGVAELGLLESALHNVAEGRPVLSGMHGDISTSLPGETAALPCVLRLPATTKPRPLVVFAAGTPCYDHKARRPTAPLTRDPAWSAHELASFAAGRDWNIAFVESPGRGRNYGADLARALPALREALAAGDQPLLLACDREAAVVVGYQLDGLRKQLAGVVLLGAGLPAGALDASAALPVRFGSLRGYPGAEAVRRSLDHVERQRQAGTWHGDVEALAGPAPAWPFGLPSFAAGIETFAAAVFER